MPPLVSIIIPTKNSEDHLQTCLESIKKQTFTNFEIIIVDNYSQDSTLSIARRYTSNVFQHGPERSAQCNFGANKAKGKYLYRVDDDFVLDRNHIETLVETCEANDADGVLTFNRSDPSISFWSRVRNLERSLYKNDLLILASRFFTKDIFIKVGGFNENLTAFEDYELQSRMNHAGGKFTLVNSAETHVGEPKSLWEIAKNNYYYGYTSGRSIITEYGAKNPLRTARQIQPFRGSIIKNWHILIKHPVLTVGLILYKCTAYISAGIGFCISFKKS